MRAHLSARQPLTGQKLWGLIKHDNQEKNHPEDHTVHTMTRKRSWRSNKYQDLGGPKAIDLFKPRLLHQLHWSMSGSASQTSNMGQAWTIGAKKQKAGLLT